MPLLHITRVVLPLAGGIATGTTVTLALPVAIAIAFGVAGYLVYQAVK